MYLGRIVEVGPTEEVLAHPRHPYTQALLAVAGDGSHTRRDRPTLLKGEPPDPTRIPTGCRFHPRCPALADGRAAAAGIADACRTVVAAAAAVRDRSASGRLPTARGCPRGGRGPRVKILQRRYVRSSSATTSAGRPSDVLPSRPTTVAAWSRLFNTASSVASTTPAKKSFRPAETTAGVVGAVPRGARKPGRGGYEDLTAAVAGIRTGARESEPGPPGQPSAVGRGDRRVGQHDHDARASRWRGRLRRRRHQPSDRYAVDGQPLPVTEVRQHEHTHRVRRTRAVDRRDDAGGRTDAALETEAAHARTAADRAFAGCGGRTGRGRCRRRTRRS